MKLVLTYIGLLFAHFCLSQDYEILEGHWKVEGKETYEAWKWHEGKLKGEAYKLEDDQKKVTETLLITEENNEVIYAATVPNQNLGTTISFKLNKEIEKQLVFENPDHDFPKKIIYSPISEDRLFVKVLGEDDQAFSYYMSRVKE